MGETNWYAYGLLLALAGLGYWTSRRRGSASPRGGDRGRARGDEGTVGATVGIQASGWTGISPPLMKVYIDGRLAGVLKDKMVHDFPVPPGRHEFMLARDWYKSRRIALTLAIGDRLDLVGGCRPLKLMGIYELSSMAIFGLSLGLVILFPWLSGSAWRWGPLAGASLIPYIVWAIGISLRPGGFIYLALPKESSG